MTAPQDSVRFYFSFRSPYSWLAFLRIEQSLATLPVNLEYIPIFPPSNFPNDPTAIPNKFKYIQQDLRRIAAAYGLIAKPPEKIDTDWVRPHAAFIYAADHDKGRAFGRGLYEARFMHGRDVGEDPVLSEVATAQGLDAIALVKAAGDEAYQTRVVQGMIKSAQEDSIFGVPYFVFRNETFWGNDRIEWLVRSIRRAHAMEVSDLTHSYESL
jgi:2-hydroxychromene-2-carboxylate isomerase